MAAMLIGTFDKDSSRRVAVTVISCSTSSSPSAANTTLTPGKASAANTAEDTALIRWLRNAITG